MKTTHEPITAADALTATPDEATADVRVWQEQRIAERLKAADAGHFAPAEAVRALVQKYIPNG